MLGTDDLAEVSSEDRATSQSRQYETTRRTLRCKMSILGKLHATHVFSRRVRVLVDCLSAFIPENASVLDVGCGDGSISEQILLSRPDLTIVGIDVLLRSKTQIPVTLFDGETIPFPDKSFDAVLFIDVLHHTDDHETLLWEAKRVCRQTIILKDHTLDGLLAGPTLRFMDWIGNAGHGVRLPYNYLSERQWRRSCESLNLRITHWSGEVGLYPWPASLLFDRGLHFVACLEP